MGLRRLWLGEVPLERAFWDYAVIGGITVNLITTLGFVMLVTVDRPLAALFVGYGLAVPYNVVATVGVWRSAEADDGGPARARLFRAITTVGMVLLSLT